MTKQIVINKCYGGFGLSPEAILWLYNKGAEIDITPIEDYYKSGVKDVDLSMWRAYLKDPKSFKGLHLTVFSPDEKFVLYSRDIDRSDPLLIECVETLKDKANGQFARLKIVDIPDDVEYSISEYDGMELVEECHRSWG